MNENLYNKKITCPVCYKETEVTKLKARACKVESRDTDFCVYYEDLNPIFYDVWVCEHCGYANTQEKFETILTRDIAAIKTNISAFWNTRSFTGDRTVDNAIETFKLALLNANVRQAKSSETAKICMRLAWLYRHKNDNAKEMEFLNFALKSYKEAYEKERFPADKLDEFTCMYMIAELMRRTGDYDEAIKWFSRLISSPDARRNAKLIEQARDQYQLAKEQSEHNADNTDN